MAGPLLTASVVLAALVLTLLAPRLLPRWEALRRLPGPALLLWQSVGVSGVACALLAAPVAVRTTGLAQPLLLGLALALSVLMLARLLLSGHRVGTDLRRRRAKHRQLIDLVGGRLHGATAQVATQVARPPGVSVIAEGNPTAYCLPGRQRRIVLTQAALDRLDAPQLRAVLAHEQGHLDARHDLLLELFTVMHEAVPPPLRVQAAMGEVHLLTEALADRIAEQRTGHTELARALVAMAGTGSTEVTTRIRLLARPPAALAARAAVTVLALLVLALPCAVAVLAWL
ncbi:Peptidase M48, Ste24p precursor [Serinicoccus hydrothermalis]|uniref:Peptidase M48, Ste24p n=1 Tax=Serinicoccus hydrothermalis TaxID=1758689 RepID=A0A1B1NC82_9MICO|nr:M56 family metallopeptidase [Serinicoccus hydrothermalis]ANS79038.1 Peptidase M48, Ste24p precursor [Serinicoccus hydrothermalis]